MKTLMLAPEGLLVCTDSAHVPSGMPMFLPEGPEGCRWHGELMAAARVGRLGKNIAPRFAARHINAYALALRLCSPDLPPEDRPLLAAGDYALAVGSWAEPGNVGHDMPVQVATDGADVITSTFPLEQVQSALCRLSRAMTLKSGDMVCVPLTVRPIPLRANMEVLAFSPDSDSLRLKARIK